MFISSVSPYCVFEYVSVAWSDLPLLSIKCMDMTRLDSHWMLHYCKCIVFPPPNLTQRFTLYVAKLVRTSESLPVLVLLEPWLDFIESLHE